MASDQKFIEMVETVRANIDSMMKDNDILYKVTVDSEKLWNTYLESLPTVINPIYRTRRVYDCSTCRSFIKYVGSVVSIDDNLNIHTIWDVTVDPQFQPTVDAIKNLVLSNVNDQMNNFLMQFNKVGLISNLEKCEDGTVNEYNHFYANLDKKFVTRDVTSELGDRNTLRAVFYRSLSEISIDAINTVLDLIKDNSIYRGEEFKNSIDAFKAYKSQFDALDESKKNLYAWKYFWKARGVAKIKNTAIGTLLVDVSNGVDLNDAVKMYESKVAPENYKRSKPIFTQKMIDDAKAKIQEMGLTNSLPHRFATLDDITVNNVIFQNKDAGKITAVNSDDPFAALSSQTKTSNKKFDKVTEMPIEKFISDVVPTATSIEVFFENKHANHLCSLIAPIYKDAKPLFKWNNNFSWAYRGNVTDSIRQNVEKAGGNVEGVLRFSIQWNAGEDYNDDDFDAHCITPNRNEIYFSQKLDLKTGGRLDVDIICPKKNVPAVENIYWKSIKDMDNGVYHFFVHNYNHRCGQSGFDAQIEFDGQIYDFHYNRSLRQSEDIPVADVTLKNGVFSINPLMDATSQTREIWGIKSNTFVPVPVICFSPNYWDDNKTGNKHYLFMMASCVNPDEPNAFFNEYLNTELTPHRKVFEALGSSMRCAKSDQQLSGLGFSSTIHENLVVRVTGSSTRVIKVKF